MDQTLKEILKELKYITSYIKNYKEVEAQVKVSELKKQGKI